MQDSFEKLDLEPVDAEPKTTNRRRIVIAVVSILLVIILAVTAALVVQRYVITTFIVDGISMYPTLDGGDGPNREIGTTEEEIKWIRTNGETLYLNKLAKIKRGDIVVFTPVHWGLTDENGNPSALVKRVIAVGGDHLEIKNNIVYLNGEPLQEPYIYEPMNTPDLDIVIEEGKIFCMGDNRNHSTDCRTFGAVESSTVIGRCFLIKSINGKLRVCK